MFQTTYDILEIAGILEPDTESEGFMGMVYMYVLYITTVYSTCWSLTPDCVHRKQIKHKHWRVKNQAFIR